jgi:uncharacterized protein YggE
LPRFRRRCRSRKAVNPEPHELVISLSVLAAASVACGQEAKLERVISISGSATVYAKPDTARVYYGVRVSEPSADAVKDVLGKSSTTIDEAVKKLKLTNVKITSAPITIHHSSGNPNIGVPVAPGGAGGGGGLGPFLGCTSSTATLTDSDPEKLRAAVDSFVKAVTEAGANTSGGELKETNINIFPGQGGNDGPKVVLARTDDSAAHEEAVKKAVEKAVRNAKAIAKALGVGEVKVISVTDAGPEDKSSPQSILSFYGVDSTSVADRAPAGEVEVKVRVIVKCSY